MPKKIVQEEKVRCETPTPGKQATHIVKWKYDVVHQAILKSVPVTGDGLLFKDLSNKVERNLTKKQKAELGSVGWYTTVVKLDMEAQGELSRVQGASPQRLIRN